MSLMRLATASLCAFFLLPTSVCFARPDGPREPCAADGAGLIAALEKSGQIVVADAVTSRGNLLQLMVDPATGDFSIVVRMPAGPGCVFHAGVGWAWLPLSEARP